MYFHMRARHGVSGVDHPPLGKLLHRAPLRLFLLSGLTTSKEWEKQLR